MFRLSRRSPVGLVLAGLSLSVLAQGASASPVTYSFTTGVVSLASTGAPTFAPGTSVSGTFTYDSSVTMSGTAPNGGTLYGGSFSGLVGSVDGNAFSDSSGDTLVGNEIFTSGGATQGDLFAFRADPPQGEPGVRNLVGFTIGGQELFNVRLFWADTLFNNPDFLVDQSLLPAPPAFQGRLALDFVPIGNPSGALTIVFFDGLFVPVPEPPILALLAASLPLLRRVGLRRRRSPA
jgi:hypothetical protein